MRAFLRWLSDDNFTFLGYREIELKQEGDNVTSIRVVPGKGLGILRDDEARMFGGLRDPDKRKSQALQKYVRQNHVLFVTKTNAITRVHRPLPMDADVHTPVRQRRHVDRRKTVRRPVHIENLCANAARHSFYAPQDRGCHRAHGLCALKAMTVALMHILNTYPHDELFQISEDELYANALGILQLQERARVALFPRRDPFGRYVTCLVYVPRDRYDSGLRARIQDFLETAYAGKAQSGTCASMTAAWRAHLSPST